MRTTLHSFLSQAELAAALAVSRQTVISIENGRYMPSLLLAFRIARFFDLPVDKMFTPGGHGSGDEGWMTPNSQSSSCAAVHTIDPGTLARALSGL